MICSMLLGPFSVILHLNFSKVEFTSISSGHKTAKKSHKKILESFGF